MEDLEARKTALESSRAAGKHELFYASQSEFLNPFMHKVAMIQFLKFGFDFVAISNQKIDTFDK